MVRMTVEERAEIAAAAGREGMPDTVWGLGVMLAVARMTKKA